MSHNVTLTALCKGKVVEHFSLWQTSTADTRKILRGNALENYSAWVRAQGCAQETFREYTSAQEYQAAAEAGDPIPPPYVERVVNRAQDHLDALTHWVAEMKSEGLTIEWSAS